MFEKYMKSFRSRFYWREKLRVCRKIVSFYRLKCANIYSAFVSTTYYYLFQVELKRLYTQLQIYKTKTMRKDNPHISKRRGGRKQTHRRFSLQPFHHKHRHHHDHEHEHEMSKTPEESTNSAEGVAIAMEGLSKSEDSHEGRSPPTVTFKPGHKWYFVVFCTT